MSVTQRFQAQTDGLDTLRDLIELAKNPKPLLDAQEAARKQIALTQAEEKQVAEARGFIGQYEQMLSDLEQKKTAVANYEAAHSSNVASFNQERASIRKELEDQQNKLDEKEKGLSTSLKAHEEAKQQLAKDAELSALTLKKREDMVQKREDVAQRQKEANEAEAARLATWRQTLDKKAKLIAEAASA